MDINMILKYASVGVTVSLINLVLKKTDRDDQAMFVTLAGVLVVAVMALQDLGKFFSILKEFYSFY